MGWQLYLQNIADNVPSYASVALNDRHDHLPPTISFVGDLEPFKDETISYIQALKKANIQVKFKLFEGAYHAFESLVPKAAISQRANQFQVEAFGEFYDKYSK